MTAGAPEARPAIPAGRYAHRLSRARSRTAAEGLDALLLGVGADLRYLTGHVTLPLERLTMLVLPVQGPSRLVVPRLEAIAARACPVAAAGVVEVIPWEETEEPLALVRDLLAASDVPGTGPRVRAVAVSDRLWATFVLGLQAALPDASFTLASSVMSEERVVKDPDEIELLRLAARAADRVVTAIAAGPLIGRTETSIAREVRDRLVAEGHDSAEFAIVGSGPNSASPHHEASERRIRAGEPIVLDIGGLLGGYGSDVTRTLWVTGGEPARGPDDEFLRLYGTLQAAQAEATHAVRSGVAAERVDRVAREIIAAAGYGDRFTHRTGHGIGLDGHEDPYLVEGNALPLRDGMAFSVEPGIYLDGRYGARIEDIVVCGSDGPLVLNEVSRELLIVAG